ncbi:RNA polymerase sigma factor SigJ [Pelomonas cellulosilytica]|uniref:RNA polymerase sigma factor SigJ n=1 Tax=Pelomonas cellulosilytica TaxID=2906762 RepID=A0ABS8Y3C5_9BURK|nr:RNA polymerase sigma factor SigJ [Pelomonas sp. P8]MCE4557593.1 RNA polymerase sigma factor SigJ [Pelomonas sp. P8]
MPNPLDPAARARRFDSEHARRLRALAYRMLGSRAEAEDIVQEAWLRWADVDEAAVENAGAYLSRLVTNLCLDRLRSAAVQREHYVGVWLPEPLLDDEALFGWAPGPEAQAEFAQDLSIAFLLTLERLSPLERAAFLLHDVFDLGYAEIAAHLDRDQATCRQLVSRARRNVKADYARRDVAREEGERLVQAFMDAVRDRDVSGLASLLAKEAVMLADGGGKVSAVPRPLQGGERIARTFIGFARMASSAGWRLVSTRVNGLPGCVVLDDAAGGSLVQTISLAPAAEPGRVSVLYIQRNPDKLQLAVTTGAAGSS